MIDITSSIVNELKRISPTSTIYREYQEQGFEESSFYIYEVLSESQRELMAYEQRKHHYYLMWFPNKKNSSAGIQEQCEEMRNKLFNEFQRLADLSLGVFNRKIKFEEGILHMVFDVRYRVAPVDNTPKLTRFEQQGGVKHG